jgi:flavin reductase (DIM6/NTAB) family NADH-FMN oxidoreductase RutF
MEICAIKFGPEVDELDEAGLATAPGQMVRSARILAAPAALECCRHTTLQVGPAREIILGEVLGVYVRSDAINPVNLHIDQHLMDVLGRMAGHTYARTRDQFDIKTQTPQEWDKRRSGAELAAE